MIEGRIHFLGRYAAGARFSAHMVEALRQAQASLVSQRERFWLWLPVCFAIGISIYFSLPEEPHIVVTALVVLSLTIVTLLQCMRRSVTAMAWVGVLVIALGFAMAQWRTHAVWAPVLEKKVGPMWLAGDVIKVEPRDNGRRITLVPADAVEWPNGNGPTKVRVTVRDRTTPVAPGDEIALRAVLMPPSAPAYPGGFDLARMAWFEGLGAVGYAFGSIDVVEPRTSSLGWRAYVSRWRQDVSLRIRDALPGQTGAFATALITGERGGIPEPVMEAIRHSGLAHLLAISGLHMGLVAGTLFFFVRAVLAAIEPVALRYPIKKWAACVSFLGSLAYLLLSGSTVPTQRAFVMISVALLAVLMDRRVISLRTVAFAAAVVLVLRPESLLSVSFQMSFAAVVALVATYEAAAPVLSEWRARANANRRIAVYIISLMLTTIVASAATAPFSLHSFHAVAVYGLAANLVAVPITAIVVMPAALVGLALMPVGGEWIGLSVMSLGIDVITAVAMEVSAWPGAVFHTPDFPTIYVGLLSLGGLWLCLWRGSGRWLALPVVLAATVLMLVARPFDLVVSSDGQSLMAHTSQGLELVGGKPGGRPARSWIEAAGHPSVRDIEKVRARSCDLAGCVFRFGAHVVAFARDGRALIDDCRLADVVIASEPVRRTCHSAKTVIDRFDVWRNGAHAIRFAPHGVVIETVADRRGNRPWTSPAR